MVRTRLAPYSDYNTEIDLDEIIRHFARLHQRRILGTGQCAVYMTQKPRKGDLRVLNSQYFRGGHAPRPPRNLRLRRLFRKLVLSIYPRFTPECASCLRRTGLKGGSCAHKNTGSHHLKESCIESK